MYRRLRWTSTVIVAAILASGCLSAVEPIEAFSPTTSQGRILALLSGTVFPDLVVEVHVEDGITPSQYALDEMKTALRNLTDKRAIHVKGPFTFPEQTPANGVWTSAALNDLARDRYADGPCCPFARDDHGVLQIIYIKGAFERDVWGLALDNRAFIFLEDLNLLTLPPFRPLVERNVILHEIGHTLGLVNHTLPMQFDRQADGHHSDRVDSIMRAHKVRDPGNGTSDFERKEWFDRHDLDDLKTFQQAVARSAKEDPRALERATAAALRPGR